MTLKNPPVRASRRALKALFVKVKPETWDNLFDYEKHNGLHEYRVKGPNAYAFYNVQGVMSWLCEMGHYTPAEFEHSEKAHSNHWSGLQVRTHSLAG